MSIIGIDFGTTNSALATFADGGARAEPIDAPDDEWSAMGFDRVLPSVFARGDDAEPLFGWAAKLRTSRKIEAVKRLLAADDTVSLDGETYYVEEIASLLFGAIKHGAAANAGLDVVRAVVTVPSNSRGLARLRTKICAGMVGIEVPVLINEPTAAAMAYGLRTTSEQNVLVVDWGGGTLDVTLLMVSEGVFIEQASKGVGKLGGVDVDKLIFQRLTEDIPDATTWTDDEVGAAMLESEKAKIRLSDLEETSVPLPRGQRRSVTRRRLNEWLAPLVERLLVPVRTVIAEGEASGSRVDTVLLVGGSCKMPVVREAIADVTGREPLRTVDPLTAVAEGAAIAAAILEGEYDGDFFVTTEHALGTAVFDPRNGVSSLSTILPRNMKLPAAKTEPFVPIVDNQESVRFEVWEGDATKPLGDDDNVKLAEWEVSLVPRPLSDARIDVEYAYDASGLLHVKVADGVDDRTLFEADVRLMTGRDPGSLVEMATRVDETLRAVASGVAGSSDASLPSDVSQSLARARVNVIPFVPDDAAVELRRFADALEAVALSGNYADEKADLDEALRRYAYLF
jgi:molecular chaperone DnaK (HSP70)